MDAGLNTPAGDDYYMAIENGLYWYSLTNNISYYLKPVEFSENEENDTFYMSTLY